MSPLDVSVDFFPHQAHCYGFGGFEVQMLDAAAALRRAGVEVNLRNAWDKAAPAPIVHHWGMGYGHIDNIKWARRHGQKVVLTVLLSYFPTPYSRIRGLFGRLLSRGRIDKDSLKLADKVIVVNEMQASSAHRFYGVSRKNLEIVPNIVPDKFFVRGADREGSYWISAGNICRRKNQLNAARAAYKASVKLVIVGHAVAGEEQYLRELSEFCKAHSEFVSMIPGMPRDSDEYIKLLANSKGLLLPSRLEQQPIIALEMGALGKHVILGDEDYARQSAYEGAIRVAVDSVDHISGILSSIECGRLVARLAVVEHKFSAAAVGQAYKDVYRSLLEC